MVCARCMRSMMTEGGSVHFVEMSTMPVKTNNAICGYVVHLHLRVCVQLQLKCPIPKKGKKKQSSPRKGRRKSQSTMRKDQRNVAAQRMNNQSSYQMFIIMDAHTYYLLACVACKG
mmetsp:Transcript_11916/g.29339  ORF Transcript_11916/g.29339 Transcript_11916/m.29339 type:complete len:116 (-) Transcript_11916:53-400(-)